ncbi:MAG: MotA/TolQ/ExbB proton channel family protein [Verrucomicrobia bacterium]|nr:MotA/TolQ/ExbB proton channel family protein [Verrucomicrobiota bacterium]
MDLLTNAGIFLYPLALCSVVAVAITIERLLSLRKSRVMPRHLVEAFLTHDTENLQGDSRSVAGRIIAFQSERNPDAEALNAFARLEGSRMERGIFLLEVVIGVAPLLGLLGTVTGLTQVFSGFSADTGLPEPAAFIKGIALALNTTILGLSIAIPALVAHAYLLRRVEALAARIEMAVQALIESKPRA